jgi:hypothetical protein
MEESGKIEEKYAPAIRSWLEDKGDDFILCIREFCQGNRAALTDIRSFLKALGSFVFANGGDSLNEELLEDLEYRIFDLIGKFSSTPGGPELLAAIRQNSAAYMIEIFAEAKRQWNLNHYKIARSYEELDPEQCLIASDKFESEVSDELLQKEFPAHIGREARNVIDELVAFSAKKFHGDKTRKVAVNWLKNPERSGDIGWFAALSDSSTGCTKVMLSRIKHSISRNYRLQRSGDDFILTRTKFAASERFSHV